jgi:Flp pilus assembly protein TadB
MDTAIVVWIAVVVVAALTAIALVVWNDRRRKDARIRVQMDELRERLRREDDEVRERELTSRPNRR